MVEARPRADGDTALATPAGGFGQRPVTRLPLLVMGMLALVFGVLAGLARLGVAVPDAGARLAGLHGALLVCGFFGTVISLERAVALGRPWAYLAPAAAGAGGIALLLGLPTVTAQALFTAAAALLLFASARIVARQAALFTVMLALGALAWLIGCLIWIASGTLHPALGMWLCFLVLTIAGERLELTRLLPVRPAARPLFIVITASLLCGAAVAPFAPQAGFALLGGGLTALAAWLVAYDIARRNIRLDGLARFIAWCLLGGYLWLGLGGALAVAGGLNPGDGLRDAAIHAVMLGFVFAMVFGHAPIIFPAIMHVRIPYLAAFYLPLIALHLSLLARLAGGLGGGFALQQWGAQANAWVLVLFVATLLSSVALGRRPPPGRRRQG